MAVSAVLAGTFGVVDLDRSSEFYASSFGYEVLAEGRSEAIGAQVWRLSAPLRWRVLGLAGVEFGRLTLLEVGDVGHRVWGDYHRLQDLGHFAPNFRSVDIADTWQRMLAAGAVSKFAPTHWELEGKFGTWDSQCFDLDGVVVDVYELDQAADAMWGTQAVPVSEMATMAIHVSDSDVSKAFYQALGFTVIYDDVLTDLDEILNLPDNVHLRNVNLYHPDQGFNGRIETAEYVGFPGRSLAGRAWPPNTGIQSIVLYTDDLERELATVRSHGGLAQTAIVRNWPSPYGRVDVGVVAGPDGETLQLIAPL